MVRIKLLLCTFAIVTNGAEIGRIIGGHDAPNHKYPYQVSFRDYQEGFPHPPGHFCSGSILNEKWILTAAHCLHNRSLESIVAVAGTNYLDHTGESYEIEFYINYDTYTRSLHHDISLVRIVGEIQFSNIVKTIPLPAADLTEYNVPVAFAGWGKTEVDGPPSNELQEIEFRVIPNELCRRVWPITTNHVCTFTKHGEGICQGDSGGPLVANGYQIGIASYAAYPCASGVPDVYTRVYPYINWIRRTQLKYS